MKRCPDCSELVQDQARKCRFCGYQFNGSFNRERTGPPSFGLVLVGLIVVLFALSTIFDRDSPASEDRPETGGSSRLARSNGGTQSSSPLPKTEEGERIQVPSDSRASYHLLQWSKLPNGNREALTRRDGPSGTSYARREINCPSMQFRYLGEGDTLEEARANRADASLSELTPGSISTYVSEFVCRK